MNLRNWDVINGVVVKYDDGMFSLEIEGDDYYNEYYWDSTNGTGDVNDKIFCTLVQKVQD